MRHNTRQCSRCPTLSYCLSRSLSPVELVSFERVSGSRRIVRRGERLFAQGETFHSLYIVQSGSAKSYVLSEDGNHQITGFHYRGDILGVDGLASGIQSHTAEVLETSSICEILFVDLEAFYVQKGELRRLFFMTLVREMAAVKQQMLVLGKLVAEQRLAHFLLQTSSHLEGRGLKHNEFVLPMARHDIANYLGLAVETVSRLLSRFDSAGLIQVRNRQIQMTDVEGLLALLNDPREEGFLSHISA